MKRMLRLFSIILALVMVTSVSIMAVKNNSRNSDLLGATQSEVKL